MARIEQQESHWKDRRVFLGKDGKYHFDFRPASKAERAWWKKWIAQEQATTTGSSFEPARSEINAELHNQFQVGGKQPSESHVVENGDTSCRQTETGRLKQRHYTLLGRRQRLRKSEQLEYERAIEENFKKKFGDDGNYFYTMMGECYIHGMMDGEAMASQNNEGIRMSVFEMR
jgi:hypothetical protein